VTVITTGQPLAGRASLKDLEDFPSCRLLLWILGLALMAEDCTQVGATGSAKLEINILSSERRCIGWDRFLNVAVECLPIVLLEHRHIHVGIAGIKHNPSIVFLLKIVEYM
jgi:hypothetical protein